MCIRTEAIGEIHVAAMRHVGPYERIGTAFEKLDRWAHASKLIQSVPRLLAIYHDDPGRIPADKLRADACVEVSSDFRGEGEVEPATVPAGRYAVTEHRGSYDLLGDAWSEFRHRLSVRGDLPIDDRPCFERYLNTPRNAAPADLVTKLCLPLKS
ncbi:MAG: GyrI-like domain-containing protein [Alphaproteobacteria bacterium]|nr:GyrI-like domain-containing protein [Alphaproteobacteria bacterium]